MRTRVSLLKQAASVSNLEQLAKRKRRSDALPESTTDKVVHFYLWGDVSRDLPDGRSAKKDETGMLQGRNVLDLSLRSAHEKFSNENLNIQISFSKFKKLQPNNVLTMYNHKRAQCLCTYCTNIRLQTWGAFTVHGITWTWSISFQRQVWCIMCNPVPKAESR